MNIHTLPLRSDHEIEWMLSAPTTGVLASIPRVTGDFVVLGVGGKMGTTTALMLRRALDATGRNDTTVTGVSRFRRSEVRTELEQSGVRTLACDLADADEVAKLPAAANVLFLAGQKFGTDDAPGALWVQNAIVPALVARHYRGARIVVFSTGCVYPFMPATGPGATEQEPPAFLGEYASTCVGRERLFAHYATPQATRVLLFRLNYAVEPRYGVLVDIAVKVWRGEAVDVTMGWFNCIWQGDACARAIQSLELAAHPARALNITGPEKLSVRALAAEFGRLFGREPAIVGCESETAWLADTSESLRLFGPPTVPVQDMIPLLANHVRAGGSLLGKPTRFEARNGKF